MNVTTLNTSYHLLSPKEKLILCGSISKHSTLHKDVTPATLAFISIEVAIAAVAISLSGAGADSVLGKRAYKQLLQRLQVMGNMPRQGVISVTRRLNDAKVIKHFGQHPEMGRPINGHVKRVTAGMKNTFGRLSPNDDVLVPPMVALKCKAKGTWDVTLESKYLKEVDRFLIDFCV